MAYSVEEILELLELSDYYSSKLSYREATTLRDDGTSGKISKYGLTLVNQLLKCDYKQLERTIMQINEDIKSRNVTSDANHDSTEEGFACFRNRKHRMLKLLHPMDTMTVLLSCCDDILHQILVQKLVSTRVSIPIVFSPIINKGTEPIILDWCVKNLILDSPTAEIKQKFLIEIKNPIISFIRIGNLRRSKSQLLADILNKNISEAFYHRECQNASAKRGPSDGSIEIAWFQSTDNPDDCFKFNSNLFTILNLRGDASEYPKQTKLLCKSSSLVVIMTESFDSLTSWYDKVQDAIEWKGIKIAIFIVSGKEIDVEAEHFSQKCPLSSNVFDIGGDCEGDNPMTFIEWRTSAKKIIAKFLEKYDKEKCFTLKNVIIKAKLAGFQMEEEHHELDRYRVTVDSFVNCVIEKYSTLDRMLPLQGALLKELSKFIRNKERDAAEDFVSYLKVKIEALRIHQFDVIRSFSPAEQQFYQTLLNLKCNEFMIIVTVARQRLSAKGGTICELFQLESIVRECGQMYEAMQSTHYLESNLPETFIKPSQIQNFAMIAADMLLLGHPLELLNGGVFFMPTIWLKAVFKSVSEKTRCGKVFVLSVIGVQSSGKSTLLNALFGLNFPTSAGKCTSGLYCHLLPIAKTTIKSECDYVMILDSEGFRAPEYTGTSTERDNEMATFIVGMSDLTIVNIDGENSNDMEDILQIVVYALLRIKLRKHIEFMPSCVFVHQKVSALDFYEKTKAGKAAQLKYLDEMVASSAKREGYMNITAFNDVVDYDATDSYPLPNRWFGNPPFATVSADYNSAVANLKNILVRKITTKSNCMNFTNMYIRMNDLWQAVLSEKFILRFRDIKEALAYQSLSSAFSKIEWNFRISNTQVMTKIANKILSMGNRNDFDTKKENLKQEFFYNIEQNSKKAAEALENVTSSSCGQSASSSRKIFEERLYALLGDEHNKAEIAFTKIIAIHFEILQNNKQIEVKRKEIIAELFRDRKMDDSDIEQSNYFDRKWEDKFRSEKERYENALRDSNEGIRKAIKKMLPEAAWTMFDSNCDSRSIVSIPKVTENDLVKKAFNAKTAKANKDVHRMEQTAFANEICKQLFDKFTKHLETINGHDFDESHIEEAFNPVWQFVGRDSFQKESPSLHDTGHSNLGSDDRNISNPGSNFKKDFIIKCFAAIGHYAYVKLYTLKEDFIMKTDAYIDIKNRQELVKEVFLRLKEPTFILAAHIMDEIEAATFENLNLTVSKALEEHDKSFQNKKTFIARILTDLAENKTVSDKEIFPEYLEFFTNFEEFCAKKLRGHIQMFLKIDSNCSTVISRLTTDIKILVKKVQDSMISSGKECSSGNFLKFLEIFREKLESKIAFCPEKVFNDFSEMITYDRKAKTMIEMVDQLKLDLDLLSDSDISTKVRSQFKRISIKDIYQRIMSGCSEQCPFCSAPCLELSTDHTPHVKHHSLHYPVGVRGIVHRRWKWQKVTLHGKKYQLVTDNCPSLIQSAKSFQSAGKIWRNKLHRIFGNLFRIGYIKYKEYKKEFPDWQIPRLCEMKKNDNDHWKWLMNKFGQEFANHYNVKHPKISDPREVECGISSICALLLDGDK